MISEEDIMGSRFAFRWLTGLLMVAMLAAAGLYTYNLGVSHGIAESGRVAAAPGTGVPVVIWPGPWGFGFGFFPFFPFLFILFWLFVARGLFWRGAWRGRVHGCGGVAPELDAWHRRAHAQQGTKPEVSSLKSQV
ncbi:MAG: hypothetical protein DMF96_13685 [Acidobacteria bacterium]|nr:MAG: hypothetical protein DMF96_13685 [Acidobacteriota bacterium]